jgi:7,8-dihydropterin-6-yl-methyl-4-(beta-D-ribofuranosyl)aminobenzene 5'-phosphate synthase
MTAPLIPSTPIPHPLRLTVLVENTVDRPTLSSEHGLSFWIDLGTRRLLFDTGQTGIVIANARELGIDLTTVDAIALSHGHYDHSGGLTEVLPMMIHRREVMVYLHPDARIRRFHHGEAHPRAIGLPDSADRALQALGARVRVVTTGPIELWPGVYLTGTIPRRHRQEDEDEGFRLDPEGTWPDPIYDDQALVLMTPTGAIVLLGCAHAGLINTLDHVRHLTGGQPFRLVMGGMHLRAASKERLAWTVAALRRCAIAEVRPGHCTGAKAINVLQQAFPQQCRPCPAGTVLQM